MPTAPRVSVPDQLFRELCAGVLSGRYAPGEKLPPQRTLAAQHGVNMASVREAVKRLEQLRLVEVRHGDAMRVRDWRRSGGLDVLLYAMSAAPEVAAAALPSLFEARRVLLREAAALAAARRDEEAAAQLVEKAARAAAWPDAERDWAFYAALIDACGNLVFALITNSIRELYFEHAQLFAAMLSTDDGELYTAAAQAVTDGDERAAAQAVDMLARRQEARLLGGDA